MGFRFDLASALARELKDVDQLGAFFDTIYQDPTLAPVKLIAEPWDLGEGGYQVGNFPLGWMEWNGKYRDTVRKFWKGDMGLHSEIATRLAGSADLYETTRRPPSASVNFVTAHDGFTLADLVSYEQKHNEANGEENRDGADDNSSWNCGAEGPTDDAAIIELRERQKRNFWCSLMFAQGSPMIIGRRRACAARRAATTTATARTRSCPGITGIWTRAQEGIPGIRAAGDQVPKAASRTSTATRSTTTIPMRSIRTRTSCGSAPTANAWRARIGKTAVGCARSACS